MPFNGDFRRNARLASEVTNTLQRVLGMRKKMIFFCGKQVMYKCFVSLKKGDTQITFFLFLNCSNQTPQWQTVHHIFSDILAFPFPFVSIRVMTSYAHNINLVFAAPLQRARTKNCSEILSHLSNVGKHLWYHFGSLYKVAITEGRKFSYLFVTWRRCSSLYFVDHIWRCACTIMIAFVVVVVFPLQLSVVSRRQKPQHLFLVARYVCYVVMCVMSFSFVVVVVVAEWLYYSKKN